MYSDSMTIAKNLLNSLNDDRHKMSQFPQAFTRRQTDARQDDRRETDARQTRDADRRETRDKTTDARQMRDRCTQTDARQDDRRTRRRRTHSKPLT